MRKQNLRIIRRFLRLTKVILNIIWLVLSIIEKLRAL